MYDTEFNKEIKEKLDMMFERKIYKLAFSILLTLAVLAQYILIIIDIRLFKKKKNNINNNTQPQIAVNQESERELNRQNNGNADIQVHIRQNILNTEDIPVKNN